jgi:arginyl-tRNA synthetase
MIGEAEIRRRLEDAGVPADSIILETPPDRKLGDIAFPCFQLAKQFRKSPAVIASELAAKIQQGGLISKAKSLGPYVNFMLDPVASAELVLPGMMEEKTQGQGKMVMVEFASPNTNKPLHLGHLRNISLGLSVSRLLENAGNKVIRACLVNDRGIHICKSMLAYRLYGEGKEPDKKPDHFVGDFYVLFSKNESEQLNADALEMLRKWENEDPEIRALWQKMNGWALKGFDETYAKIGARFDRTYFESEIYMEAKQVAADGLSRGKFIQKEGAVIAQLEGFGLPDKVIVRKDGTSIYITQDIYLAMKKF